MKQQHIVFELIHGISSAYYYHFHRRLAVLKWFVSDNGVSQVILEIKHSWYVYCLSISVKAFQAVFVFHVQINL